MVLCLRMDKLDKSVMRYYETQFCDIVKTDDWLSLSQQEVARLVSSDALVASESVIIDSILTWWTDSSTNKDTDVLNTLLSLVRFPLCPPSFLQALDSDINYSLVRESEAYKYYKQNSFENIANPLSKSVRCRGKIL